MCGMDKDDRELLEKTLSLAQENNVMLRSMRRSMRWSKILHATYWIVIIALSVGAYIFIEPYLKQLLEVYNVFNRDLQNVQGIMGNFGN